MTHRHRTAAAACWTALSLLTGLTASHALTVNHNVSFTKVGQNPWDTGSAAIFSEVYRDLRVPFNNVSLTPVSLNPFDALSSFMGINVGFARVGAVASGSFGMDFGLYADGGKLNITYPGTGRLDIATRAATNDVSTLGFTRMDTAFIPGLYREFKPDKGMTMALLGGAGYDHLNSIPGYETEKFLNPTFKTSFPTFAAFAEVNWSVTPGVRVEAGVMRVQPIPGGPVACIGCTSRTFNAGTFAGSARLVDINPNGVQLIGQDRTPLFDYDIGLGGGSVRVSYPDLAVGGVLGAGSTTLRGSGAKPIITFNGHLEQMVPFVGPFLHQNVGPFDVKLLGVSGGPKVSLYQDFEIKVDPKLELEFSQPVIWQSPTGPQSTMKIVAPLGQALDWKPIPGSKGSVLMIQPRYILDATVENTTGLALGYHLDIDALAVEPGGLGPIDIKEIDADAAIKLPPLYKHEFKVALGNLKPRAISLDVVSPVYMGTIEIGDVAVKLLGATWLSGNDVGASYDLTFAIGNQPYTRRVNGTFASVVGGGSGDSEQRVLNLDSDLTIDYEYGQVRIGNVVCLSCEDNAGALQGSSPFFIDAGEEMYFNPLTSFRIDQPDLGAPALNASTTPIDQLQKPLYVIGDAVAEGDFGFGPITPVPEPAGWALWLAGALLLAGRRSARTI